MSFSADELVRERADAADEDVHFPMALVRAVLDEYTSPGDTVLDPFAGFGTTLLGCAQMGRGAVGIELLPERVALIRQRLAGSAATVIEGDARRLDGFGFGPFDLCLTSPPYMSALDQPSNPLTGYTTTDGHYPTYVAELTGVFAAVAALLRPGGHLVINAANIRNGDVVTPLAWDIAHAVSAHLSMRTETYLHWDQPPEWLSGDYCLVFQKT